jgi:hypothetical protein
VAVVPGAVLSLFAAWSGAAAQDAPAAAPTGGGAVLYLIVAVSVVLAIVIVAARLHDLRNRRETEALALQSRLSDALLTDRAFQGTTVTATVHAPLRQSAPLRVEVSGQVPSQDLRAMVLRRIQREAAQAGRAVEIEDRVMVLVPAAARVA